MIFENLWEPWLSKNMTSISLVWLRAISRPLVEWSFFVLAWNSP